ncbi:MAG TPA: sulfatase-like hydrolase/transferase [Actinomycetota bacterium]|nr:sulfatase-like hydrolase/transferase [Actinomycetota bacterium]
MPSLRRASTSTTALALVLGVVITIGITLRPARPPIARAAEPGSPDVIVIVTDDQRLDTRRYMPRTKKWLGSVFVKAFASNPSCCPSRVSMFTGSYSHTNTVWSNGGGDPGTIRHDFGGWQRYEALELDRSSIALAMQRAGYRTGHFGKFLNVFDARTFAELPVGWDAFSAFAVGDEFPDGPQRPYYEYSLAGIGDDGGYAIETYGDEPRDHSTRVLTKKAISFIESTRDRPLFLHLAYPTPHARHGSRKPVPLRKDLDRRVQPPDLSPAINEADVSDKPSFIRSRDRVPARKIERWRLAVARSIIGLDRKIDAVLSAQAKRDPGLRNTFVMLISDNGHLYGDHRFFGKGVPYEGAIRIPLLVHWDRLPEGQVETIVANVDVAPTIADVAGIEFDAPDGRSILSSRRRFVLLEGDGKRDANCGIRTDTRKYLKYATGEEEFYNLARDPYELRNNPDAAGAEELHELAAPLCAANLPPGWPRSVEY